MHVWKLIISSNSVPEGSDVNSVGPSVAMKTVKVCTQKLALPDGVGVVHACPAAGHLRFVNPTLSFVTSALQFHCN